MREAFQPYTYRQHMITKDYEVFHYRSTYMETVALHHHDFYEIYLLLGGKVEYIVENRLYQMRPGDIMLVSPLELHQARISTGADAYERIVLWVERSFLERLSSPRTSLTRCFDASQSGHSNLMRPTPALSADFRRRMEELGNLRSQEGYGCDLLADSCLTQLLVKLNLAAQNTDAAPPNYSSDQVVDAVLEYINRHYNDPLSLDSLSERFFISKYHLLRKFDHQVGTTVHRYIQQKRLLNARQLLVSGVAPNEVCQYCGFGDYTNFYRAFKAEYHMTPREFVQFAKNNPGAKFGN
ncbi:MAG: AraC family transcriptional regulator [Gemmiger sp.]|nr:AraC family transcriptional regulator [Gemmiger sp.]